MQALLDGYARFRSTVFPQHANLFADLAHRQSPQALFITCSDSRVMPELITQCAPGEIFPCRNAGNLVPPPSENASGVAATIEYAVRALKVPDIVVCGHSDCGAMHALLEETRLEKLPSVRLWLQHAGPMSRWLRSLMLDPPAWSAEEKLRVLTEVNVITQLQNLRAHPAVTEGLHSGRVRVHGWVYDIASGDIRSFDPGAGMFTPLLLKAPTDTETETRSSTQVRSHDVSRVETHRHDKHRNEADKVA